MKWVDEAGSSLQAGHEPKLNATPANLVVRSGWVQLAALCSMQTRPQELYALSPEGPAPIRRDGKYLPLTPDAPH
jgi:hypothetical protein